MKKSDERGIALILALLVLALLVALIIEFDAEARRALREAGAFRDGFKANVLSQAAVQAARAVLKADARQKLAKGQKRDALTDFWAEPIRDYPLGDGVLSAQLVDERGKLNLNALAAGDPKIRQLRMDRFERLCDLIQVDPRVVEAIADWVDPDNQAEPNGAERGYYETLDPPYRPANGPLKTLGDLRLIKGVTDDMIRRLEPYVTVYPARADGWINLNTADPLVIESLDERITSSMALEILQARPFKTTQDAYRVKSFESIAKELRLVNAYKVQSDHFSGRLTVTINDVTKFAHTVLQRSGTQGETSVLSFRIE